MVDFIVFLSRSQCAKRKLREGGVARIDVNLLDGGLSVLTREVVQLFDQFRTGLLATLANERGNLK